MTAALQIGYACVDITPEMPCPLLGYTQRTDLHGPVYEDVLDPLYARIVVIDDGHIPAALLSCDLCILEDPAASSLRDLLAAEIGSSPERVMIAATHTHSGPYAWSRTWPEGPREYTPDLLRGEPSEAYWEQLQTHLLNGIHTARQDLQSARLRIRTSSLGFAYTRRVTDDTGRVEMCWNPKERPDLHPRPAEDDALVLLEILRDSGPDLLLYNLAGHPVVLGKESNRVSADWPGAVNRIMETALPGTRACFLHGAGADAHPWLATDHCPEELDTVAAPVAGLLQLLHASGGHPSEEFSLSVAEEEVVLPNRTLRLTAWRLGPLRILAFPGELFGESGRRLRQRCPGPLFIATTTNGWSGYWPPVNAFDAQGYELDAVRSFGIGRGDTETVLDAAEHLLHTI